MGEKKTLTKSMQIIIGTITAVVIYGLYLGMFKLMLLNVSVLINVLGIILTLAVPIICIISAIKLIKGITYDVMGITILVLIGPILIFSLVAGTCLSLFSVI